MKIQSILGIAFSLVMVTDLPAQTSTTAIPNESPKAQYASISNELEHAIDKGIAYLNSQQKPEGFWQSKDVPAMSALVLCAIMRDPAMQGKPKSEQVQKAYKFIIDSQKEDGGIWNKGLAAYNTSVCLLALLAAKEPAYDAAILKARAYLIRQQNHFAPDNPYNGGIGYGGKDAPPIADLSNTTLALEAIYYSKKLAEDGKFGKQPDLDWKAATDFISRCQQNPATNKEPWVSNSPEELGGFVYRPGESKAAKSAKLGEKAEPIKAYGSMSYAGMQSLIYADVKKDDPRVKLVLDWLSRNFTVDENPHMGDEGLYYYYQAMAKALSAAGVDVLKTPDGKVIDWRDALARKLLSVQKSDGSWVNTNNRWWEADPILVTAYTVLALEQLYYSIPK